MNNINLINGDAIQELKKIEDNSIDCIITSHHTGNDSNTKHTSMYAKPLVASTSYSPEEWLHLHYTLNFLYSNQFFSFKAIIKCYCIK